jgi:hypothetical protein
VIPQSEACLTFQTSKMPVEVESVMCYKLRLLKALEGYLESTLVL